MSRTSNIPSWWLELTGASAPGALLGLLDQVERAGISRNDKTGVTRIWRERQIVRALQNLTEAAQKTIDPVPEMGDKTPAHTANRRKPPPATPTETEHEDLDPDR